MGAEINRRRWGSFKFRVGLAEAIVVMTIQAFALALFLRELMQSSPKLVFIGLISTAIGSLLLLFIWPIAKAANSEAVAIVFRENRICVSCGYDSSSHSLALPRMWYRSREMTNNKTRSALCLRFVICTFVIRTFIRHSSFVIRISTLWCP